MKTSKVVFFGAIAVTLIIAAIKNPSSAESKQIIKDMAIEKAREDLRTTMVDDIENEFDQLGSMLGLMLAPAILDNIVDIEVSDYVVFSTFNVTASNNDDDRNLATGLILFGNVIPLSSDVNMNTIEPHQEIEADDIY